MFLIFNTIVMIAVFVLVLCFSLEAMKVSTFSRPVQILVSLSVALLCATSLFPVPLATTNGAISVFLLPYQALGVFVLLIALVGFVYKFMGEKKRAEINRTIKNLFNSNRG